MRSDKVLTSKRSKELSRSRKASFVISQNHDFSEKAVQTPSKIAEETIQILQVRLFQFYSSVFNK